MCQIPLMNTFFAFAIGGVMLVLVCRSMLNVWRLGSVDMSASDRRVARAIVAAVVVACLATVIILKYSQA
jgi:hypothetical protein